MVTPPHDGDREEYQVGADDAGERLDRVLARIGPESRSVYQRWIREGRVEVDGESVGVRFRPREGQRIVVRPAPPPPSRAEPEDLPLTVLYEDEHLCVLDKAPFMVVHPAPGHPGGTLVNALLHRYGALAEAEDGPPRPGIVHRLDAGTSGVMVVARTSAARGGLIQLFAAHDIERSYLAIALGRVTKTKFDTLHGRHPVHRKRFSSRVLRGKRAVTTVSPREELHGSTLVSCVLETGRTHQIRVHLADANHPLLADPMYGRRTRDERLSAAAAALGRQALHAAVLGFVHPVTGEPLRFSTEPPEDFQRALELLREPQ